MGSGADAAVGDVSADGTHFITQERTMFYAGRFTDRQRALQWSCKLGKDGAVNAMTPEYSGGEGVSWTLWCWYPPNKGGYRQGTMEGFAY